MLNDLAYHLIASILDIFMWDGELMGEENLGEGPAVIVANHMGSIGPVGICCSLPMRLYPWVLGVTVDKDLAPDRVRKDFVEGTLKLKPPISGWIAKGICKISSPLLLSLGCIPIYSTHQEQEVTFQRSLALLCQGKFLLVVPEDLDAVPDPQTGIRPFKRGFLRLGEQYAQATGQRLPFYPVAIHEAGLVIVGKPIAFNPFNEARKERYRMVNLLEETIKEMYIEVTADHSMEPEFSRRKIS
jgi:hypothetical protein